MLRRAPALRAAFLASLVAVPMLAIACGDDPASTPAAVVPDASIDEAGPIDAGPQLISVTLAALLAPPTADAGDAGDAGAGSVTWSNYVVFYPKENPSAPAVEPIAYGQTVTRSMPAGAHVVVVQSATAPGVEPFAAVLEIDDVTPGETIMVPSPISNPAPAREAIRRFVPALAGVDDASYTFASCHGVMDVRVYSDEVADSLDPSCIEPDGRARFMATAVGRDHVTKAIGATVGPVVLGDGGPALVTIPAWTTPAPTTWNFSGASPSGPVTALVMAANTGRPGSFSLAIGPVSVGSPLSFLRPPAGFNDGEIHQLGASFVFKHGSHDLVATVSAIDRTAVDAPLTSDLGSLGAHLVDFGATASSPGAFGVDFRTSAPLPPDALVIVAASGPASIDGVTGSVSWIVLFSNVGKGHLDGLVLPAAVHVVTAGADSFVAQDAFTFSGVESRLLRASPSAPLSWFNFGEPGADLRSLPSGNFKMTTSSIFTTGGIPAGQ